MLKRNIDSPKWPWSKSATILGVVGGILLTAGNIANNAIEQTNPSVANNITKEMFIEMFDDIKK